jgi:hypothetical protein
MSNADQFWEYAREAILSASSAETDEDRQRLLELAQTWTLAAIVERRPSDKPSECILIRSAKSFDARESASTTPHASEHRQHLWAPVAESSVVLPPEIGA